LKGHSIFKFSVLSSGSRGNCIYLESDVAKIIIDSGLSVRELKRRLMTIGRTPEELDAVFLTHEHSDHIGGVGPLVRKHGIPLYATEGTVRAGEKLGNIPGFSTIRAGETVRIDGLEIEPYATSHDARESVAYVVRCQNRKLGHATDMGRVTHEVREKLKNSHVLLVESNHDVEMLDVGPYPWPVKQRIKGELGHLSNEACGELLAAVSHEHLERVLLMHLSQTNNHSEIARITALQALGSSTPHLELAQQDQATELIAV
jgi:phosphoribosyl 1,2-cyclic phosphodiesterase|tara:strand:+ start:274 stop:1053 length:780 start_codon:yes stop_codon:yes gene_type:complete